MKRSVNIEMMFTEVPFEKRLRCAKEAGFDAVEFAGWLQKDLGRLERAAQEAEIDILAFTGDELYSPIDPDTQGKYIELVGKSVEAAKRLGAKLLVTHSNALDDQSRVVDGYDHLSDEQKLLTLYDTYQKLAAAMEGSGITLLVEALSPTEHPGVFMDHADTAARIVQTIDSPGIRLLCDLYHMQANGGRLLQSLQAYRTILGHVHFADLPGRHEPGTGEVCFEALWTGLETMGYSGHVGFALVPLHTSKKAVEAIMKSTDRHGQ